MVKASPLAISSAEDIGQAMEVPNKNTTDHRVPGVQTKHVNALEGLLREILECQRTYPGLTNSKWA
jgi:hypothetical protein